MEDWDAAAAQGIRRFLDAVHSLSEDLCTLLGAVALLSERYFSGEALFLPDQHSRLADLAELPRYPRILDLLTSWTEAERKRHLEAPKRKGTQGHRCSSCPA